MRVNLLLVETDHLFRSNLSRHLAEEGFAIFTAERPTDVKRLIKKKKIDVALLDLSGLRLEGVKLLKQIKRLNPLTEVITLSTGENMALAMDGMKLGAFDDLLIPVNIRDLVERVRSAKTQKLANEKKFLPKGYQKVMMAATFAEAGETETAKALMKKKDK
jgi:DNA-binding NtrC family response regulator